MGNMVSYTGPVLSSLISSYGRQENAYRKMLGGSVVAQPINKRALYRQANLSGRAAPIET